MLITIEGIDGCGKTTSAEYLVSKLRDRGLKVIHTRELGGTQLAEILRELVITDIYSSSGLTDLLMAFASRMDHVEKVIKPALDAGEVVICERFIDSTYAYQLTDPSYKDNLSLVRGLFYDLEVIIKKHIRDYHTLYLDIPIEESTKRLVGRKLDKFEKDQAIQCRVVKGYSDRIAQDPKRFLRVNANQSLEGVKVELDVIVEKISTSLISPEEPDFLT
ncbi:MAG: dTMP kinase [Gammaproteobacteria bacterium]|nr:dTMP kinase [Gammaproteobacteria bacterium]